MTIHVARDLKLIPIETLQPYERNSRTHSKEQIDQIAKSIQEFGFTNPILTDGQSGIIAGHGRLAAAKKLGLRHVPVIDLAHLSPAQKRAYVIADNKIALNAGWDLDILAAEIATLGGEIQDFDSIGFSDDEISNLLAGLEDLDPEPQPVTRTQQPEPIPQKPQPSQPTTEQVESDPITEHWVGMPEFKQEDKTAFRTIPVHFANEEHVRQFEALIKQTITDKTRYIWFPFIVIDRMADKLYTNTSDES